jgi:hypothetical protein
MHKSLFVIIAIPLLLLGSIGNAKPQGITMDMINTTLPLEGSPPAEPGPYKVTSEITFGSPSHILFRPADLRAFPAKDILPVLVWGNGGCAIDSNRYGGFLTRISHKVS